MKECHEFVVSVVGTKSFAWSQRCRDSTSGEITTRAWRIDTSVNARIPALAAKSDFAVRRSFTIGISAVGHGQGSISRDRGNQICTGSGWSVISFEAVCAGTDHVPNMALTYGGGGGRVDGYRLRGEARLPADRSGRPGDQPTGPSDARCSYGNATAPEWMLADTDDNPAGFGRFPLAKVMFNQITRGPATRTYSFSGSKTREFPAEASQVIINSEYKIIFRRTKSLRARPGYYLSGKKI